MPNIVHHTDPKIAQFIRDHYEFFPFEASPLGDMTFSGKLTGYLKPLNPLTFEQLLVELATAADGVLLYAGHGNMGGVVLPLTDGTPNTSDRIALEELAVLDTQAAARKTLLSAAVPAEKEAKKVFLKKVADLVVQLETAMNAVRSKTGRSTGTVFPISQLKQNIDKETKNVWEGYDFSGFAAAEIPPQDLVLWCNQQYTAYAKDYGFPTIARLERFFDRRRAVQAKTVRLELRVCRVGRSQDALKALRNFLGDKSKVAAPVGYTGWGFLNMQRIQGDAKAGISAKDAFQRAVTTAQTSTGPLDNYRLFTRKTSAPVAPTSPTGAAVPPAATASASPSPQPVGAPSTAKVTLPPGPTVRTASILLQMHETERSDIHTAKFQSWYVDESDYDAFLQDYGMDGKPGFRVPAGKTKYQATLQYIVTDDLTDFAKNDPQLALLSPSKFNIPYFFGGLPDYPIVLPGDPEYRKVINSEPPWYP